MKKHRGNGYIKLTMETADGETFGFTLQDVQLVVEDAREDAGVTEAGRNINHGGISIHVVNRKQKTVVTPE